jgi:hypothetical protein
MEGISRTSMEVVLWKVTILFVLNPIFNADDFDQQLP